VGVKRVFKDRLWMPATDPRPAEAQSLDEFPGSLRAPVEPAKVEAGEVVEVQASQPGKKPHRMWPNR